MIFTLTSEYFSKRIILKCFASVKTDKTFFDDFVIETTNNNTVIEGKDAQMAPGRARMIQFFQQSPSMNSLHFFSFLHSLLTYESEFF